jgi:hypothetical protein
MNRAVLSSAVATVAVVALVAGAVVRSTAAAARHR